MFVFRLEDSRNELPKYWAYEDAWEINNDPRFPRYIDNRQPGFQVWKEIGRMIAVASGDAMADGDYDAADYPWVHLIKVDEDDLEDGVDEWFAVDTEAVQAVRVIPTADLIAWCKQYWEKDVADGYDAYEDDFERWCSDLEDEILEYAKKNSKPVKPKFIDTLPHPEEEAKSKQKKSFNKPKDGDTRINRAGNQEVLHNGRWHLVSNPKVSTKYNPNPAQLVPVIKN